MSDIIPHIVLDVMKVNTPPLMLLSIVHAGWNKISIIDPDPLIYFSSRNLPTLTYVRSFRLLRILKTEGFAEAIKSVVRVFRYNSEILYVAVCIGSLMVVVTSVLMYYLRPPNNNPQFESLPATIYLSTLMLTGQGGPDPSDEKLPWYTCGVVLLTGIFSIGMFAIPASMLTWGFEGEAERLYVSNRLMFQ
jgi:hypothetical protein